MYMRLSVKYIGGKNSDGTNKHEAHVQFAYSEDGKNFHDCGDVFTMRRGKWVGAKVGILAAEKAGKKVRGWVDVDWFRITK
jgi:hypothetical protein